MWSMAIGDLFLDRPQSRFRASRGDRGGGVLEEVVLSI